MPKLPKKIDFPVGQVRRYLEPGPIVLVSSKWGRGDVFYPPYGKRFAQVMGLLKRWF